jgi:hypothetical protein
MSTKFVVVKEEPKDISKDSMVIKTPDFLEEIKANKQREPRGGYTSPTHLRYIAGSIGARYDQELGAYTIKPHLFEGRKYNSDEDLSKIVVEMLRAQYPKVFQSYIDYKIKSRSAATKLIYFVGDHKETKPFLANGLSLVDESDLDAASSKTAKNNKKSAD